MLMFKILNTLKQYRLIPDLMPLGILTLKILVKYGEITNFTNVVCTFVTDGFQGIVYSLGIILKDE